MRLKIFAAVLLMAPLYSAAAILPETKPERVGLSSERLRRIHETMQRHIDERDIAGAVTLVMRKGQLAHFEAHGLMDVESKKPMAKNAIFRIWSMSKPVAGTAILMLMEEGKVRLNDPVSKFIPEFKGMKVAVAQPRPAGLAADAPTPFYTVPALREINVQDLLTHVSGLASGPVSNGEAAKIPKAYAGTIGDVTPKLGATPLEFQPGSRWSYSPGAAFDTLGRIVEVASGMSFDKFLKQRLFDPLGMKETSFHPAADQRPRIVTTYHRADGAMTRLDAKSRMLTLYGGEYSSGAGGLYSTIEDYALFAQMLLNGGQWNGERLLSPKSVELMSSIFVPDTLPGRTPGKAFGLSVQVISDPVAAGWQVSKGSYGWDGAFGTHFWIDPKEKIVGIMLIQTDNPNRQLDRDFENAVFQAIVE
ncbi:MAG: serine hydrolase domain-containing protein [Bryobacteraceae bacterium]